MFSSLSSGLTSEIESGPSFEIIEVPASRVMYVRFMFWFLTFGVEFRIDLQD